MALYTSYECPCRGLVIAHSEDEKFNTESIVVRFIVPLEEKSSQKYTALVSLMAESCREYPDKADMAKKLASLYGASVNSFAYRLGNSLCCGLAVSSIGDRYTINGENITEECAKLLLSCIFEPDITNGEFPREYFEQKKRQLIDKIKSSFNNRHTYAVTKARDIAFAGEPAAVSPLGSEENANALTSAALAESHRELLENAFISISFCGGGTNKGAQKLVKNAFVKFASKRKAEVADIHDLNAYSPLKAEPHRADEKIDQAQSKLVMFFKTAGKNIYADRLACELYGGTPFSKLFMNVREKLSLCYYCQSGIVECKAAMLVDSGVEPGNEEKAYNEIIAQLEALRGGDFTDEELENTKKYLIGAIRSNYDSAENLNLWYFYQFARGTAYSPDEAAALIKTLSREDVLESLKNFKLDTVYTLTPEGGEAYA